MSSPLLSKKQQRHSLSAKKTPVKGLRNVLAQPYESYWPIVDSKSGTVLEGVLALLIKAIRRPSAKLPWSQLRHIKKEDRAKEREQALSEQESMPDKNLLKSVVTGINAVTRALEKKSICCVLLDSNVEPSLLIKHIVMMAKNKQVPVLLVPFLKSVTASSIGYASASLALKSSVADATDHHFHLLYTTIMNAMEHAPKPKNILQLSDNTESSQSPLREDTEVTLITEPEVTILKESTTPTVSTNVYKYRTSSQKRAFVPPSGEEEVVVLKTEPTDFISISQYDSPTSDGEDHFIPSKRAKITERTSLLSDVQYVSLKVKKQQGNPHRAKATKASKKMKK